MCNSSVRTLAAAFLLAALTACSPRLDWREMPAADGAVQVAFPARPHSETRELPVAGQPVPFTLTAAAAADAVFAVGYMDLPADVAADPAQREQYVAAMEDSLARNLQADQTQRRAVQVRHVRNPSQPPLPADELELHGTPNGESAWMLARILLVENRLIEVAAVGRTESLTPDAARMFVDSLRVQ